MYYNIYKTILKYSSIFDLCDVSYPLISSSNDNYEDYIVSETTIYYLEKIFEDYLKINKPYRKPTKKHLLFD
jgi:hypothetical protein